MSGRQGRASVMAIALFGVVAGMVGLSFASVPLYRMFCQATGYDGTPRTENIVRPSGISAEQVVVQFDANVSSAMPWRFQPAQRNVRVHLGEEKLVHFTAKNLSAEPITGTATFNVVPEKAARYFNKIECFCFSEQTLAAGQEVSMPVVFFVDPALADDATARDATTITLSYMFFRVEDESSKGPASTIAAKPAPGTGG